MKAEFKEKTYELQFHAELTKKTNIAYAPDQIDEALLGFDGSFFLGHPMRIFPFPFVRARRRHRLVGIIAKDIQGIGDTLDSRLPPFRLNLFVQYKRPEWLSRRNAGEWSAWNAPYYRYAIDSLQQKRLEAIIDAAGDRAAVIYAAAAFYKNADLFRHMEKSEVIANSNIGSASRMSGHSKFTYSGPGSVGFAHSDPERVESPTLDALLEGGMKNKELPFTQHLLETKRTLQEAVLKKKSEIDPWEAAKRALVGGDINELYTSATDTWLDAAISIAAFRLAFDTSIISIGELRQP
jgi:hypothetical protein